MLRKQVGYRRMLVILRSMGCQTSCLLYQYQHEVYINQYKPDDETIVDEKINKSNEHKIDNVELQDHVKTIALSLFKQVNEDLKFDETNEISNYDE